MYLYEISAFKKIIFQLFKELQDRKVVDNFNVTSVHYLLDKICINTNYLEVICFKNLSQSTVYISTVHVFLFMSVNSDIEQDNESIEK
jgi:hypothetical protein